MIVLHTVKYGETSLIVHGYTREDGRGSFMLRGAFKGAGTSHKSSSKGSTNAVAALHPLSIINFESSRNTGRSNLRYFKEFAPKYNLYGIRSEFARTSVAIFIGEVLYRTLLLSERDEAMYDFIEDAILKLENTQLSTANFHIWFLDRYVTLLGFPFDQGYAEIFNPFSQAESQLLQQVHESEYERAMQVPMTGEVRSHLLAGIIKYLEYHLGTKLEIKSLQVLRSMNADLSK